MWWCSTIRAPSVSSAVRPDVLVKGEDWRDKIVDGQIFVESYGGRVALAPLLPGYGTTLTIERLRGTKRATPRRAERLRERRPSRAAK